MHHCMDTRFSDGHDLHGGVETISRASPNDAETPVEVHEAISNQRSVPVVPKYWHFAPLTLRFASVTTTERLFQILHDLDVNVEVVSFCKYRLQKVYGRAYLDIQCHFFKQDSEIVVDINLLSGDRFVWHNLARNIRTMFNGGQSHVKSHKPHDFHLKPEQLFQLLEHGSMNKKRKAMRSLALSTTNVDISKIEPWLHKSTNTFLEKEIQRWAEYIKANRAHL